MSVAIATFVLGLAAGSSLTALACAVLGPGRTPGRPARDGDVADVWVAWDRHDGPICAGETPGRALAESARRGKPGAATCFVPTFEASRRR